METAKYRPSPCRRGAIHPRESIGRAARRLENDVGMAREDVDRACAQRDLGIMLLKTDPLLRGLRGDPRYMALLKKLNLPVD